MNDLQIQRQFIELRSQGWSFSRIAAELNVSKPTLIAWSRKFQYEIQNLRAIELEALTEKWMRSREQRIDSLGEQLQKIEAELGKREVSSMPTGLLFSVAASLRRQIQAEAGDPQFTIPVAEIPKEERVETVQDWQP